jgi:Family of unknown function (DUF5856)
MEMYPMMPKGVTPDVVARKLYALDVLAHANHVNTRSYAAHKAFGNFYEFTSEFKDRIIEHMMGKGKLVSVKVAMIEVGDDVVAEADAMAAMVLDYARMCNDEAMINMAAEFAEAVGDLKYMLMLK